jgi:glucose-6-phosphate-specific signal transduction histidine kinase
MILPGLISVAFYKRRPSRLQISLGLLATIALSALLGYLQDEGTSRVWLNVTLAIAGGIVLYVAILVYLLYRYQPHHAKTTSEIQSPGGQR